MSIHVQRQIGLQLPHPLRDAAPLLALAAASLAFEADRPLALLGAVAAAGFAVAALVRIAQERLELRRLRREADELILHGYGSSAVPPALVVWRMRELTSEDRRAHAHREVAWILRQLDPALLPGSSPLNRCAARASEDLLRRIDARLADPRPVTARGMLLLDELLSDSGSALYDPDADESLRRSLTRVLGALEP